MPNLNTPAVLSLGSAGPAVQSLQARLNASPPTALPLLIVDGRFGPKTQARVREFQRNNGLNPDGIAGPLTLAKLGGSGPEVPRKAFVPCGNSLAGNQAQANAIRQQFLQSSPGQSAPAAKPFPTDRQRVRSSEDSDSAGPHIAL